MLVSESESETFYCHVCLHIKDMCHVVQQYTMTLTIKNNKHSANLLIINYELSRRLRGDALPETI